MREQKNAVKQFLQNILYVRFSYIKIETRRRLTNRLANQEFHIGNNMLSQIEGLDFDSENHPGIRLTCVFMHGSADAFTTHTHTFPHSDDGARMAKDAMIAYDELALIDLSDSTVSSEDVARDVAHRTSLDYSFLENLFVDSLRTDAKFDEFFAEIVGYSLEAVDELGKRSFAQWQNDGLCEPIHIRHMGTIDISFLEPWYGKGRRHADMVESAKMSRMPNEQA